MLWLTFTTCFDFAAEHIFDSILHSAFDEQTDVATAFGPVMLLIEHVIFLFVRVIKLVQSLDDDLFPAFDGIVHFILA